MRVSKTELGNLLHSISITRPTFSTERIISHHLLSLMAYDRVMEQLEIVQQREVNYEIRWET